MIHRACEKLVVVGPKALRDPASVGQLVGLLVLGKADRERLDGLGADLGHESGHEAGVKAAAQHHAQGHVADHARSDRLPQQRQQILLVFLPGNARRNGAIPRRPVDPFFHQLSVLPHQCGGGRQLLNAGEKRSRARNVAVGEIELSGHGIEARLHKPAGQQRLDLRGEGKALRREGVVEGLHAHPITGEHQPPACLVPYRNPEHAPQAGGEVRSVLLIQVHDRLGVSRGPQTVTFRLQLSAQLWKVENLAVKHRPHVAALVAERLMAVGQVDDAQPAHAHRDPRSNVRTVLVGATVDDHIGHRFQHHRLERRPIGRAPSESTDAAHPVTLRE